MSARLDIAADCDASGATGEGTVALLADMLDVHLSEDRDLAGVVLDSLSEDLLVLWSAVHCISAPLSRDQLGNAIDAARRRVVAASELHTMQRNALLEACERLAEKSPPARRPERK